ncbi:23S rRNA pseudouridine(2604) synthase RluF [Clostridium cadaveris]|uniref:Pseudouridine synthase n=2 Tax=Clostridium cadaveris TaxID=1529 RepID=A0A316M1D1_9CLOT|nr:23S rRNA pseudouridine(2604) synthase RluF [Clostridium cadaveris]NWK09752.1 23S rRNA pseudouridine(2604) synthase RluF [Clostridium cadaveris]PWL51398.1 MAG: 23S rRNA pseudouridine(2604) synthase RluF [Clostridium cadaveris]UFH64507.1 23S rRNA pseudouridine(2604) synthase RluF [Clostridium cadaveris]
MKMSKSKFYCKKNETTKIDNYKNKSNDVTKIIHEDKNTTVRLNKYIGESGYCSRREADKLIEKGSVKINNKVAIMGDKVSPGDKVYINNKLISSTEDFVYIALNKPVGITCTTEHKVRGNIVDFIGHEKRIFPIGRLDKDSQGLIFLTNDGDIVNKILRAGNNHEKEYIVTVNKPITPEFVQKMSSGVPILDTVTKKCMVKHESKYVFRIILTQGLNRQIRRMCSYLGYEVTKLERIRIMNVSLGNLPIGKWRYLSAKELEKINELTRESVKTKEASED